MSSVKVMAISQELDGSFCYCLQGGGHTLDHGSLQPLPGTEIPDLSFLSSGEQGAGSQLPVTILLESDAGRPHDDSQPLSVKLLEQLHVLGIPIKGLEQVDTTSVYQRLGLDPGDIDGDVSALRVAIQRVSGIVVEVISIAQSFAAAMVVTHPGFEAPSERTPKPRARGPWRQPRKQRAKPQSRKVEWVGAVPDAESVAEGLIHLFGKEMLSILLSEDDDDKQSEDIPA